MGNKIRTAIAIGTVALASGLVGLVGTETAIKLGGRVYEKANVEETTESNEFYALIQEATTFVDKITPENILKTLASTNLEYANFYFERQGEMRIAVQKTTERQRVLTLEEKGIVNIILFDRNDSITNSQPFGYQIFTNGKFLRVKIIHKGENRYNLGRIIYNGDVQTNLQERLNKLR